MKPTDLEPATSHNSSPLRFDRPTGDASADNSDSRAGRYAATILENRLEKPRYHRLVLQVPPISRRAQPGQYVHILTAERGAFDPLLRRAFSIMAVEDATLSGSDTRGQVPLRDGCIQVLFRVEGRGTRFLASRQVGDSLDMLGPLGRPFPIDSAANTSDVQRAILVGGGIGAPPMVFLARRLKALAHVSLSVLLGVRGESDLIGVDDFQALGVEAEVASDDGSVGHRGKVTELLEKHLMQARRNGENVIVHSCGPWPMLRAVAALCEHFAARCYVSLEENMPCGIGVCNGCVVPTLSAADDYGLYRRICVDGPVMDAREVDWR